MPKMMEVYKSFSDNYDELLACEDYEKNLNKILLEKIDWNNKVVYEAGIGTGRVTNIYIDKVKHSFGFDREQHMIDKCKINLSRYLDKISFKIAENTDLPEIKIRPDIFIEGWSLGHTIIENSDNFNLITKLITDRIIKLVKSNGSIVIIESAGTNCNNPFDVTNEHLNKYYSILETEYGFEKNIIATDYKFLDYKEAAEKLGFFFGDDMKKDIIDNQKNIIPEYTGVWIFRK